MLFDELFRVLLDYFSQSECFVLSVLKETTVEFPRNLPESGEHELLIAKLNDIREDSC
jgi:hypothetical protein